VALLLGGALLGCADGEGAAPAEPTVTEDPSDTSDPTVTDITNEIEIVDGAVHPRLALAKVDLPLEFHNTTPVPQEIRFTNLADEQGGRPSSGPIAPGETYVLEQETEISITYDVVTQPGVTGVVQVEPGVGTL
jgi:hypothetical protein